MYPKYILKVKNSTRQRSLEQTIKAALEQKVLTGSEKARKKNQIEDERSTDFVRNFFIGTKIVLERQEDRFQIDEVRNRNVGDADDVDVDVDVDAADQDLSPLSS